MSENLTIIDKITSRLPVSIQDLNPYQPGKTPEGFEFAIKLASNENSLGPSPMALECITKFASHIHRYPDGGCNHLKEALSQKYNFPSDHFIVGNGSNELLVLISQLFLQNNDCMMAATPSFIAYNLIAKSLNKSLQHVSMTKDYLYDVNNFISSITPNTKLIIISNPNNPTGSYLNKNDFELLIDHVPKDTIIIMDEAYYEYVVAEDYPQTLSFINDLPNLLVLRSFSKIYGLAGLRVGYGIGHPKLINYINRIRQPFNVNSLAQRAAIAALTDREHINTSQQLNTQEKKRITTSLKNISSITVVPSIANFIFIDLHQPAGSIVTKLMSNGISVRPMQGWGVQNAIRVTIGTPEENTKFLNHFCALVQQPK